MQQIIDDYSHTEYLLTFLTFIYSFIATQFFDGWGKWLQNVKNDRPSLNHVLFSLLAFLLLIDFWWISFPRGHGMSESLPMYFVSLLSPIVYSVLTFNIFPRGRTEDANLAAYFDRRSRFMFAVLGLDFTMNIFSDQLLMNSPLLGTETIFRLTGVIFCSIGIVFPNRRVIRTLSIVGFAVIGLHVIIFGDTVESLEHYSLTEYLTIFITLIFGVIASRFISGWSHILQHIKTIQFSKEHFGWTVFAFCLLIDYWWGFWPREPHIKKHLGYFLLTLMVPIQFYALVILLFPFRKYLDQVQLLDYFNLYHRRIVALIGGILLTDAVTANVLQEQWATRDNLYRLIGLLLVVGVLAIPRPFVRRLGLITGSLVLIIHAFYTA